MSLSTRIAPHLPYLRRFARAVTGSQTSGDAHVAALLETLIADLSAFPDDLDDRVALHKLLVRQFGSREIAVDPGESPFAWEQRASANLARVPPRARQAFLLVAVEGFSPKETGEILEVDEPDVHTLLGEASGQIAQQVQTDILIIEDEPLIAMDIESLVTDLGHRVSGVARTRDESVDLFARTRPGMVLADIQLADGSSGIDAVNQILDSSSVPVIFITAYPERLLTGERPEPTFLVTKPFSPDMVKALISQALFFNETSGPAAEHS